MLFLSLMVSSVSVPRWHTRLELVGKQRDVTVCTHALSPLIQPPLKASSASFFGFVQVNQLAG